jgi:hypothetical protein
VKYEDIAQASNEIDYWEPEKIGVR